MNTRELSLWLINEIISYCEVAWPNDGQSREDMVKSLTVSAVFRPGMARVIKPEPGAPTKAADWMTLIKHPVLLRDPGGLAGHWVEGFGGTEVDACLEARDKFIGRLQRVVNNDVCEAETKHRLALAGAVLTGSAVPNLRGNVP